MNHPMRAEIDREGSVIETEEAVSVLIEEFDSMEEERKRLNAIPYSDEALQDDNQSMAEDDMAELELEPFVESFREAWRGIAPDIKAATLQELSKKGREDVVKEIQKFN